MLLEAIIKFTKYLIDFTWKRNSFPDFFRYNANKATEDAIREHNARMKPIWDAEKAAAKAKSDREGLLYLAKETGVKVSFFKPFDFT